MRRLPEGENDIFFDFSDSLESSARFRSFMRSFMLAVTEMLRPTFRGGMLGVYVALADRR